MRGLDDKVAVIIGAAPGNIGAAAARRLAQEGAVVITADLRESAAAAVAAELPGNGHRGAAVDISDPYDVRRLIDEAVGAHGRLDVLFNVAADLSPATIGQDSIHDVRTIPLPVWQRTIDVTLTGYMLGTRFALPHLIASGGGAIINTMSAAVFMAEPVRVAYASAKAGLAALTRHTATIAGQSGVRCNAIAPGTVLTEALLRTLPEVERERQLAQISSTRLGTPEDIAAMVAFLASEDGAWINGQVFAVDGGQTKH